MEHGQYQMNLGAIIKALSKERNHLPVFIDFPAIRFGTPEIPHSYYGYHSDLAFVPSIEYLTFPDKNPKTVNEFLEICKNCIDKSFLAPEDSESFYRDKTMQINTPCWISKIDEASNLGITDIVSTASEVVIKTGDMPKDG